MKIIIEYKRAINEKVINQGLFYLDWLLDHKGEFELPVQKTIGSPWQERIEWPNPRLPCIAGDYTKYDREYFELFHPFFGCCIPNPRKSRQSFAVIIAFPS